MLLQNLKFDTKYTVYQENQYFVKNMLLLKNPQFYPNHYSWVPHFRKIWDKIVDFFNKSIFLTKYWFSWYTVYKSKFKGHWIFFSWKFSNFLMKFLTSCLWPKIVISDILCDIIPKSKATLDLISSISQRGPWFFVELLLVSLLQLALLTLVEAL